MHDGGAVDSLERAGDGRPRLRDVEPGEGRREPGEVALAADLAVADDVDARSLHVTDDQTRRVVLSLLAEVLRYTPERRLRHPRHAAREQRGAIDEPFRLRKAAHDRGRQQWQRGSRAHDLDRPDRIVLSERATGSGIA